LPVLPKDWYVPLRQKIAHVNYCFHVGWKKAKSWNSLANKKVQVGIALAG
jgi:hypothetical protein